MFKQTKKVKGQKSRRVSKIAQAIADLEKRDGTLTPKSVVDAARDPKSPLHKSFTWDDTKAAQQWRLFEAAELIRTVKIVIHDMGEPVVKYVSMQTAPPTYYSIDRLTAASAKEVVRLELERIAGNCQRAAEIATAKRFPVVAKLMVDVGHKVTLAMEGL